MVTPLLSTKIAGTSYLINETPIDELEIEDELILIRENNPHDIRAIMVLDSKKRKLGYIPRKDNYSLSKLMDNGLEVKAVVDDYENDDGYHNIFISVYPKD